MNILYLSHCVPYPPDKGEKIRAFHEIRHLTEEHQVHVACLARSRSELRDADALRDRCASVSAELFHPMRALAAAGARFAAGACLTTSYYGKNAALRRKIESQGPYDAVVVYSAAMAPYVPDGTPTLLDLVDVDSEKWLQYSRARRPGFLYGIEGRRLRRFEDAYASRAACSFLTTRNEIEVFRSFSDGRVERMENGVDLAYFNPAATADDPDLASRRFVVFVGAMDYYPNADAACWFAENALAELQSRNPGLGFYVVGRNPTAAVRALAKRAGVRVTGAVPDVRPYLKAAVAAVAPLRIARGVQNKVLEALAMGRRVLASPAVCDTLSPLPPGVVPCPAASDYARALESVAERDSEIRAAAAQRFSWDRNMQVLSTELCRLSKHKDRQTRHHERARAGF